MSEPKKKPGVAYWTTVVVVVLALLAAYPLSLGPAQWLDDAGMVPDWADKPVRVFYAPLTWIFEHSETARTAGQWYVLLWVDRNPNPTATGH